MNNISIFVHMEFALLMVTLIVGFYYILESIEKQASRTDQLYKMFVELIEMFIEQTNKRK